MTASMERRVQKLMVSSAGLIYVILTAAASVPTMGSATETFEKNFTPWHPWIALFCLSAALVAVHVLGIVMETSAAETAEKVATVLRE